MASKKPRSRVNAKEFCDEAIEVVRGTADFQSEPACEFEKEKMTAWVRGTLYDGRPSKEYMVRWDEKGSYLVGIFGERWRLDKSARDVQGGKRSQLRRDD